MQLIKCLFCGKQTSFHKVNAKKSIRGKTVTLREAPVYYCAACKETFLTKETQQVFRHIQDNNMEDKTLIFTYDDLAKKAGI